MKSKKLLAFALSMAVAAGCTACGGGQASTDTSAAGSSDSTQAESSATGDNTVIVAMGSGFSTLDPGYVYEKYPQLIVMPAMKTCLNSMKIMAHHSLVWQIPTSFLRTA